MTWLLFFQFSFLIFLSSPSKPISSSILKSSPHILWHQLSPLHSTITENKKRKCGYPAVLENITDLNIACALLNKHLNVASMLKGSVHLRWKMNKRVMINIFRHSLPEVTLHPQSDVRNYKLLVWREKVWPGKHHHEHGLALDESNDWLPNIRVVKAWWSCVARRVKNHQDLSQWIYSFKNSRM